MSLLLAVQGGAVNYALTALAGTYSLSGGSAQLTKTSAPPSNYALTALGGIYSITGGDAALTWSGTDSADTHDGFWAKQWKKAKQRETQTVRIEEIEEQIAEIQERLEVVEPVVLKPAVVYKSQEPDYSERLRIIDMLIAHRERLIEQEDEELLLLL